LPNVLLDTHILIWWLTDPRRLSRRQSKVLQELEQDGQPAAISAITLWESAMLVQRKKIEVEASVDTWIGELESHPLLAVLPITARIAAESVRLNASFPKDPADRLIVATARCHGLSLITADQNIRSWGKVAMV
jgi:PIN domain nuclease of toxin-antitoxin system